MPNELLSHLPAAATLSPAGGDAELPERQALPRWLMMPTRRDSAPFHIWRAEAAISFISFSAALRQQPQFDTISHA